MSAILQHLRTYWTDPVISGWLTQGLHKLSPSPRPCDDCGHPTAYFKAKKKDSISLCSACMVITAKFPYAPGGAHGEKIASFGSKNKAIGGFGLLFLPDRNEVHLWLNASLRDHIAFLAMHPTTHICVHRTENTSNTDTASFHRDLFTFDFRQGEAYWAGSCQNNDAHKVATLLHRAIPSFWNGTLIFHPSLFDVLYFPPQIHALIQRLVRHPAWLSCENELKRRLIKIAEFDAEKHHLESVIQVADTVEQRQTLEAELNKKTNAFLRSMSLESSEKDKPEKQEFMATYAHFLCAADQDDPVAALMLSHLQLLPLWQY